MATALEPRIALTHGFADAVPEMATPWKARTPPAPRLLVLNETLATELGLDPAWLRTDAGIGFLTGVDVPEGAAPVAQAYSGHQFGGFSPHLGDGRALLLGEVVRADGAARDIHLKGSGRTPYARGGDGFAAVGPMLREYLISEAMHALGIPTTRSLAVTATGGEVERELLLPGALLTRVASSHLRVGSFQYARGVGIPGLLERLTEHAIARHRPDAASAAIPALELLQAVIAAQAELIAKWMLVGFVHGVMNTDNMTISGETIDYGPCAFMDAYDPASVYSSIDTQGRYAYAHQPLIAEWNLARLAESLLPLLDPDQDRAVELAQEALAGFAPSYNAAWAEGMRHKLGLADTVANEEVARLGAEFLEILRAGRADFTSGFRALAASLRGDEAALSRAVGASGALAAWLDGWRMLEPDPTRMDAANPLYIPRNHLVEEALAAASAGDLALLEQLLAAVTAPFDERPGAERFAVPAPPDFGAYRTFCGT